MNEAVKAIHKRFTYRMQDLGEFMKGLLRRFTQWFNRAHSRTGRLWENRFKSLIVEDGVAAKGNGKTARAGLVRALGAHQGVAADAALWKDGSGNTAQRDFEGGVGVGTR
jgi:hypothetical protein